MEFKFSNSDYFLFALIFFILGIAAASFLNFSFLVLYFLFLIGLVIFILAKNNFRLLGILIIVFILGILRYQLSYPKADPTKIQFYNEQKITFIGQIFHQPDLRSDKILLVVKTKNIIDEKEKKVSGKVLVNVPLYSPYQYGDILKINCRLRKPGDLGKIPYHEYLARYDIYSTCSWPKIEVISNGGGNFFYRQILSLKNKIKDLIDLNFSEPQGSIISALLVGLRRDIPKEVSNWFSKTGVSHILAISGLHLSIMTTIISTLLIFIFLIPRPKTFWLTFGIVSFYVILVGFPASVIRSAIMGLSYLFAEKIGRPQAKSRLVILAASLMLFLNPKLLVWDIGFQLSFLAVFGMVYLKDYFNNLFYKIKNWKYFPVRECLSITLSAQIFTLPLVLYYFGNLSLITPLANILILPAVQLAMGFGFIFIFFGLIWSVLAQILVWPIWFILTYIVIVAKALAELPYFSFNLGDVHWLIVLVLYIIIVGFIIRIRKLNEAK